MTLKLSNNLGKTWEREKVLYTGAAAYSDLTLVNKDILACLYEAGIFRPYEGIVFKKINIK
jgi:sialidase-1